MKNQNNFIKGQTNVKVLIAPLDWGLGHATRCIPIIYECIKQGCDVLIAADKHTLELLKKEFPYANFLRYKGYEIRYSRNKAWFAIQMFRQLPKIVTAVIKENRWLRKAVKKYKVDAVLSDNRFGMFCKQVPCVYITHQLFIKTGNRFTETIARRIHYYFIKKYTSCWVPDFKENGLAGELSHPQKIPGNVIYIGPLSRFEKLANESKVYDLLIVLSGPEPQRSIFENIIFDQLKTFRGKVLLVRGLPSEKEHIKVSQNLVEIVNYLSAKELNLAIAQSKIVVCRSGYTSVMDLFKLQKPAILVPTPGQTEQEYLAAYLSGAGYFYKANQDEFSLNNVLEKVDALPHTYPGRSLEEYKKVINEFVLSLKTDNFAHNKKF